MQNGVLTIVLPAPVIDDLMRHMKAAPGAVTRVDLRHHTVAAADGTSHRFDIDATRRERLLKGLDDVGVTLQHLPQIEAFEAQYHGDMPWLVDFLGKEPS